MNVFPIVLDDGIVWKLFSDSYSLEMGQYVARILFEIRDVFTDIFGDYTVNAHPVLGVLPTQGNPQTERANSIIFISKNATYIQIIYQFSHELCHFMIPGEVSKSYRWFEETLCQIMSWYAMKFLYCSRFTRTTGLYSGLSQAIPKYIAKEQTDRVSTGGLTLSHFIRKNLNYLHLNCYDRRMNRAIAYEMYPLFLETPGLWGVVPFLHSLTDEMSLSDALTGLCRTIDVEESRRDQFIQRLTE